MAKEVVMPRLSDTMSEGTVSKWRKQVGDEIKKGEIIAEIETDKATQDLESYDSGILTQIVVNEGQTVALGATIALISAPGEVSAPAGGGETAAAPAPVAAVATAPAAATANAPTPATTATPPAATPPADGQAPVAPVAPAPAAASAAPAAPATPAAPTGEAAAPAAATAETPSATTVHEEGERIKASPVARRMAQEHDIDLATVTGTGPEGRIIKEDIENYLKQPPAPPAAPTAPDVMAPADSATPAAPASEAAGPQAPAAAEAAPSQPAAAVDGVEYFELNRMQRTIARRMVESRQQAPYFYATTEIDMGDAGRFRKSLNEALAGETSVSYNDLVMKACALALRKFPLVNAGWADGRLAMNRDVNVGFAAAVPAEQGPGGLVVPVIRNVDQKSLRQIAIEAKQLIEKARNNRLSETDLSAATFSVSNLGMFEIDQFTAIINPPQSAILAVGSITKKPVVKDDQIVIGERMRVTLSVDHRVFYGLTAAQFLQEVKRVLEHPFVMA